MTALRSMTLILPLPAGCAATADTPVRYPQNPDQFLSTYNWGGWFQNVDRITVDRQKRAGRYAPDKYGTKPSSEPVTYKGAPPGGPYTLVAEPRAAGKAKTELNVYHLAKPFLSDPLKRWVANDSRDCPGL